MLTRRLLCKQVFSNLRYACARTSSTQEHTNIGVPHFTEEQLPPRQEKEKQRHPFAKNFCIGRFDTDILCYPEIGTHYRHTAFTKWLRPVQEFISSIEETPDKLSKQEILRELAKLGVFRGSIPLEYDGLDFFQTERARLIETLSSIPWLGIYLVKNNIIPVDLITKHGSKEQKEKYLPKIASGEIVPCICLTEFGNGTNVHNMKSSVTWQAENSFVLNGTKYFVCNAVDANLYIVFAKYFNDSAITETQSQLTAFLIEKQPQYIKFSEKEDMIGQTAYPLYTVTFKNTPLTDENLIGSVGSGITILKELLPPGRQCMSAYSIGVLKRFCNMLIQYVLHNKHLDKNMYEIDVVKEIVTKICGRLYSMESTVYLTTGLEDLYNEQDVDIEKAITETYCARECVHMIYKGLQLLSTYGILRRFPYVQFYDSSLFLPIVDSNITEGNLYIALLALQYAGKEMQKDVKIGRNPTLFPKFHFLKSFRDEQSQPLDLCIPDNLHPSLGQAGRLLESSVTILKHSIMDSLTEYGSEICKQHNTLKYLSEIVTLTYVTTASLARSSRSYCLGFKNAEADRWLADAIALESHRSVERYGQAITNGDVYHISTRWKAIVDFIYHSKKYFADDPLKRL